MQEDKESIFDAIDTVKQCLTVFPPMLRTMKALPDNMLKAAQKGFINATDLADYLTKKGIPFRTAYKLVGQIVAYCIEKNTVLEALSMEEYQQFHTLFEQDVFDAIDLRRCVESRISAGGTNLASIEEQIKYIEKFI
jgi:argininosuccinate lyase